MYIIGYLFVYFFYLFKMILFFNDYLNTDCDAFYDDPDESF